MSERAKVGSKKNMAKEGSLTSKTRQSDLSSTKNSPLDQVLNLQRTVGNQTVQRLFDVEIIQPKLKIGQPGDKYELEADRIAEQVMRMPDLVCPGCTEEGVVRRQVDEEEKKKEEELVQPKLLSNRTTSILQRQSDEEEREKEDEELIQTKPIPSQITHLIQRQVEDVEKKKREEEMFQAKENSGGVKATTDVESNIISLRGGGEPLPESMRSYFEPRFGYDFSQVRIHKDTEATETAKFINAKAFTSGRNVIFGTGQYSPETLIGKRLLTHELVHVVQQVSSKPNLGSRTILQRTPQRATATVTSPVRRGYVYPPVYYGIDHIKRKRYLIPKRGSTLEDVALFIYGRRDAARDLAKVNNIDPEAPLVPLHPLKIPPKMKATDIANRHFRKSSEIPIRDGVVTNPEAFLGKKKVLDDQLEQDFRHVIEKLDESYYSDSDEGEVISILRKWGKEKFTTNPQLYPHSGEYLDKLFSKLNRKSKKVGIITTQWTNYYSLIFNHFDRVNEVKMIRDIYSKRYKRDSGLKELSFGSFFWEEVKEGRVRDNIFAYFQGMREAGIGLVEGMYNLVTDPIGTFESIGKSIGKLPETLGKLWENREMLWKKFLNAEPTEQARMIGRLFGEAEIIIATFGAGSEGSVLKAPEMATAVEFVAGRGGTLAMLPGRAGTIGINMAQLGKEGARMAALTSKAAELSKKGEKEAERLAKEKKSKLPKESQAEKTPKKRKGFSSEEILREYLSETNKIPPEIRVLKESGITSKYLVALYENHHLLVRQLKAWFSKRRINIDKYTIKLSIDEHKLIHNEYKWNQIWKEFKVKNPTATKSEIMAQLDAMLEQYGLKGLPIIPYK